MELPPFQNEPPTDWSRPENVSRFEAALKVRPATPSFVAPQTARLAIESTVRHRNDWQHTPVKRRADMMLQVANLIRKRRMELAAALLMEVGKNRIEADAEVCEAIDFLEYYAREALRLAMEGPRVPLGLVAVIAPWNFPLAILTGMTAAALVAGNSVVMKPAEQSSGIGKLCFNLFLEAGIPEEVLKFLPGAGEIIGVLLVRAPEVDRVCFTGSKSVGMRIASLKPGSVAEMGGKNAIIVDASADLDAAAEGVVLSAFGYQGQKCSACSRVILLPNVYEKFRERFLDRTAQIRMGDPRDPANVMGPVIDGEAAAKIRRHVELGKREGRLLFQGNPPIPPLKKGGEGGFFIPPTIFEGVTPTSKIAQEEIFGPVVCLMKAKNLDEALAIANGVPYDLTGGLFSKDPKSIERARKEFEVGNLYINRKITGALVACQPFGGYRLSSLGFKAGGPEYLHQFLKEPPLENPPAHRDLPSAAFQANDRNELVYIQEGDRLLGQTICTRS